MSHEDTLAIAGRFIGHMSDAFAMVAKNATADLMAIIEAAREEGARDALVDLATSARIPIHRNARSADARNALLAVLLGGDDLPTPADLAIADALRAAATAMGVSLLGATLPGRKRALSRVRWAVWQALRDLGYSLPAIGRLDVLGTCHHSTVLHGLTRVDEMAATSDEGRIMLAGIAAARSVLHTDKETT